MSIAANHSHYPQKVADTVYLADLLTFTAGQDEL
jgi:hypothetical protein